MKIKRISDQFARNFKMRICHISDTHGKLPRLYGRYDVVVHTGDMFPNSHHVMNGERSKEAAFQLQWLRDEIGNIKSWLQGHPFLFVLGNHDFINPEIMEAELLQLGVEAYSLHNKSFSFRDVNFYGFPYVPAINGMWNYEKEVPEMRKEVDKMAEELNKIHIDVLACHSPPYQNLDLSMSNLVLGSTVIADALDYQIKKEMMPSYYLCGHIHEANGMSVRNGMVISNAATTRHIIEML